MAPLLLNPNQHESFRSTGTAPNTQHSCQHVSLISTAAKAEAAVGAGPVVHACSWRGPGSADLQAVLPSGEGAHGGCRLDPALRHQAAQQLWPAARHRHAAALAWQCH